MGIKLYDSELKVMEILWKEGELTAGHIAKILKEELIDRMFEGSKKNFFAAMLSENSLTAEELEQLKDMVNQMK